MSKKNDKEVTKAVNKAAAGTTAPPLSTPLLPSPTSSSSSVYLVKTTAVAASSKTAEIVANKVAEKTIPIIPAKPIKEETGILYSLVIDEARHQLIGVKRFGGYFCYKCNASLLAEGEETARNAIKHLNKQCPICLGEYAPSNADIVPCAAFDWIMAPHLLPRKSPPLADDHVVDEKSRRRRTLAKPSNLVVDQFGNTFELEHFWKRIVDPCPIQFYERIRQ